MAESIIQVTSAGATKLHTYNRTIGANSVEDEVVLLGENYLATYTMVATSVTTTALSHLIQVMAGASLKVRIRRITVYQTVAVTAAAYMELAILRLTTAGTGGTAVTAVQLDPSDGASGATGISIPGVKGTEGNPIWFGSAYLMQTVGASTPQNQPIFDIDFDRSRSKPLIIAAGVTNGICLRNTAAHAGATVRINVLFDESNF